ncbi:MAG: M20 aminoacylase family protein [Pseudomonadota bacterium]
MQLLEPICARQREHSNWRRQIHSRPELAYNEHETSAFVQQKLTEFGMSFETGLGQTGVVGILPGENEGPAIGLRADMDALPLHELNEFPHRSKQHGVMHACGHDGHTTMLLAAAEYLTLRPKFSGTAYFIFQPAEEGEAGAKAMIDDGLFERFPMTSVYGIHNWPGLDVGKMAMRPGPMMAAMDTFELVLRGRGGHAALPHQTADPIVAATTLVQAWQGIVSRNVNPIDSAVLSVTQIHAGDAWAVIPNEVLLRGTVRSFRNEVRDMIEDRMQEVASGICHANHCAFDWHYERRFPATCNWADETGDAARAARKVLGDEHVDMNVEPSTGSEDFGYMLEAKPGCYAFIGNGPRDGGRMLHSPHFDFNDEIIPIGASYWVTLVEQSLASKAA